MLEHKYLTLIKSIIEATDYEALYKQVHDENTYCRDQLQSLALISLYTLEFEQPAYDFTKLSTILARFSHPEPLSTHELLYIISHLEVVKVKIFSERESEGSRDSIGSAVRRMYS